MEDTLPPDECASRKTRAGQSLIEACLVIALLCLILFGLLQVSLLVGAREILHHAAARGCRAKTVGFNRWMVAKSIRIASIPNAGEMIQPEFENVDQYLRGLVRTLRPGELWSRVLETVPSSLQYNLERARIPEYMASHNDMRAHYILDYAGWDSVHAHVPHLPGDESSQIRVAVFQDYPLWAPFHRAFYAADSVTLKGESYLECHYPLYIDDHDW